MSASTINGPTGSNGPTGPLGSEQGNEKMRVFQKLLNSVLVLSNSVIKTYADNIESYSITYKEMDLKDQSDVDLNLLHVENKKYIESVNVTTDDTKLYKLYLSSFNKILMENPDVLLQTMDNDSWIRKCNPKTGLPLQLMFGDVLGKTSTICSRLGMIYKMSLAIKSTQERKIKEYPDLFKPDEKVLYSNTILLNFFKIFYLTDRGSEPDMKKAITLVVNNLSSKLGINNKNGFDLSSMFDGSSPLFSVGVDLINKHLESTAVKDGKPVKKIEPNQLQNIFGKVLNTDKLQKVFSDIRDNSNGGPPDFGKIFGSVMQNLNPSELMEDLKNATETEMPDLAKQENKREKGENKQEKEEQIEEIEEEINEPESKIDEDYEIVEEM